MKSKILHNINDNIMTNEDFKILGCLFTINALVKSVNSTEYVTNLFAQINTALINLAHNNIMEIISLNSSLNDKNSPNYKLNETTIISK